MCHRVTKETKTKAADGSFADCGSPAARQMFFDLFLPQPVAEGRQITRAQSFPTEEAPGISVFYKDDAGDVLHTYSTYGRGVEDDGRVQHDGPHARGPRRARRAPQDGVGASPRPLRAGAGREGSTGGQFVLRPRMNAP